MPLCPTPPVDSQVCLLCPRPAPAVAPERCVWVWLVPACCPLQPFWSSWSGMPVLPLSGMPDFLSSTCLNTHEETQSPAWRWAPRGLYVHAHTPCQTPFHFYLHCPATGLLSPSSILNDPPVLAIVASTGLLPAVLASRISLPSPPPRIVLLMVDAQGQT